MNRFSLVDLLSEAGERHRDRVALRFDDRVWTYQELSNVTNSIAAGLIQQGIQPGDRVAFLLTNCPELIFLNLACIQIGAIAVPMNVRLKGVELAYILNHCRARLVFVHQDLLTNLDSVRCELTLVESFFVVGATNVMEGYQLFGELTQTTPAVVPSPNLPDDAAIAILYTSGTTARPKGVTHTNRSLTSTAANYVATIGLKSDDIVFGMLSMSHIFGYTLQLLSPLSVGATVVASHQFDANRVIDVISRQRVTHLFGLPVMFDALTRQPLPTGIDVRSLRYCLAGGDAVSQRLNATVYSVLGAELYEGCGMTEVIPYTLNRPGIENRIGSIGKPSNGMSLRLVDDQGQDVSEGEVGEILVRGEGVTAGYWQDPAVTEASFLDGWFRTGDLGRRDKDGYYWFVGRSKEIIIRGGSNISPLEVEGAIARHPAVYEVAVAGIPDTTYGEIVAAFVILKPDQAATESDLRQFAAQNIADYKLPERFTFLAELPRGLTGKIQRKALRDMFTRAS